MDLVLGESAPKRAIVASLDFSLEDLHTDGRVLYRGDMIRQAPVIIR